MPLTVAALRDAWPPGAPPLAGAGADVSLAGLALDCAAAGIDDPALLGLLPGFVDRWAVLSARAAGTGFTAPAPAWRSWLLTGRPGYTPSTHLIDQVPDEVWAPLTAGDAAPVRLLVCDLTWSARHYWPLACDLRDLWGLDV